MDANRIASAKFPPLGPYSGNVLIYGHSANVVINTGSNISLFHTTFANRPNLLILTFTPLTTRSVETIPFNYSETIPFNQVAFATLSFLGFLVRGQLFLIPHFTHDGLIGTDCLNQTPIQINCENQTLENRSSSLPPLPLYLLARSDPPNNPDNTSLLGQLATIISDHPSIASVVSSLVQLATGSPDLLLSDSTSLSISQPPNDETLLQDILLPADPNPNHDGT